MLTAPEGLVFRVESVYPTVMVWQTHILRSLGSPPISLTSTDSSLPTSTLQLTYQCPRLNGLE